MTSGLALKSDPACLLACTISRDVLNFGLLIDEMEAELGEGWGDLALVDAVPFLNGPEADTLDFVALAVDRADEASIAQIADVIAAAKRKDIKVILVAADLSTQGLHQILKLGADDFVPYPLVDRALHEAIARLRQTEAPLVLHPVAARPALPLTPVPVQPGPRIDSQAAIFAVQSLAGGTGATTLAVNLAYELATIQTDPVPSVCLIDLDLQFGTVATSLDLTRRGVVLDVLSDTASMDADSFRQALQQFNGKLSVFTAPSDMIPLDMLEAHDVGTLLDIATSCFDIVVVDMPSVIQQWTETVLNRADVFFVTMELDMRSAQNAIRFIKAVQSEDLPLEKVNFVLNRAPKRLDLNGKARVRRLADSLNVKIATQLSDGARVVTDCADQGAPLAELAKKNPLRKDIAALATGLHKAMLNDVKTG